MEWKDPSGLAFLRGALSKDIFALIKTRTTLETALDALLSSIFHSHKRFGLYQQLRKISTNQIFLIQDCSEAVNSTVRKWSATTSAKKGEIKRKSEEVFFEGLPLKRLWRWSSTA